VHGRASAGDVVGTSEVVVVRVVVVGATGNVGTAVLRRLGTETAIDAISGIARRIPPPHAPLANGRVDWQPIDIGLSGASAALTDAFAGAGAVIQLAWQIQPSHDRASIRRTNVKGASNVVKAAIAAKVPTLIVASSVGAYSPAPKEPRVDEAWPATGVSGCAYSQDKAAVEALLDGLEDERREPRIVRLRPALTFQRSAASEIARLFVGPLAPLALLRFGRLPVVPSSHRLRLQATHADDVADAYVRALLSDLRGALNIAAEPPLDAQSVAPRFGGRPVPMPPWLLRQAAALSWRFRLQPTEPGWIRLATGSPLMSCLRAETELGWRPRISALDALAELIDGLADSANGATAPLRARPRAVARLGALAQGRLPGHGNPY